jgi:hypothetical protein
VAVQEYDEWVKRLPDGKKIRYSCQLLTTGFTASAEIVEPFDATMVYTHTQTDLPAPADRAQIEAEFADELLKVKDALKRSYAPVGRYRSAG